MRQWVIWKNKQLELPRNYSGGEFNGKFKSQLEEMLASVREQSIKSIGKDIIQFNQLYNKSKFNEVVISSLDTFTGHKYSYTFLRKDYDVVDLLADAIPLWHYYKSSNDELAIIKLLWYVNINLWFNSYDMLEVRSVNEVNLLFGKIESALGV